MAYTFSISGNSGYHSINLSLKPLLESSTIISFTEYEATFSCMNIHFNLKLLGFNLHHSKTACPRTYKNYLH